MQWCLPMIVTLAITCIAVPEAGAEPLLTISCDKPNGFNIAYGTTLTERVEAREKKQPVPLPALTGPTEDGMWGRQRSSSISNQKNMTVIWAELPEDVRLRKRANELNIPQLSPSAATDATVVLFWKEQISAIKVGPFSIVTYSFFPTLGTAFIGEQYMQPGSKNITQLATFAHCKSWTSANDQPD